MKRLTLGCNSSQKSGLPNRDVALDAKGQPRFGLKAVLVLRHLQSGPATGVSSEGSAIVDLCRPTTISPRDATYLILQVGRDRPCMRGVAHTHGLLLREIIPIPCSPGRDVQGAFLSHDGQKPLVMRPPLTRRQQKSNKRMHTLRKSIIAWRSFLRSEKASRSVSIE